jgi:hypothetical protein
MSAVTSAMTALATTLGTVATVRTGRAALETTSATLPVIALTPIRDERADNQEAAGSWFQTWERTVVIEGFVTGTAAWATALDDLLDRVRRALAHHPHPLTASSIALNAPETNGAAAWFSMPVVLRYSVDYSKESNS